MQMTDTWTIIGTVAAITLGAVGGSTWHLQNQIDNLIFADITHTENVDQLRDADKDFIRAVTNIENLTEHVKNIDENIKDIQENISSMENDISVIQNDIRYMKKDIEGITVS